MSSALIRELLFSFSNVLVTELCRDTEFCLDLTRGPKILVLPYTEELKLQTTMIMKQNKIIILPKAQLFCQINFVETFPELSLVPKS